MTMAERIGVKALRAIPRAISTYLAHRNARLARWYECNGVMKFPVGTILKLNRRHIFGFGIRPIATVVGHVKDPKHNDDRYLLDVSTDIDGDFFGWASNGKVAPGVRREVSRVRCFKWNVEHHMCPVPTSSPEEAYT